MASGEGEGEEEEEEEEEEDESDSDGDKKVPSKKEVVKVRMLIRSQTTLLFKQCLGTDSSCCESSNSLVHRSSRSNRRSFILKSA